MFSRKFFAHAALVAVALFSMVFSGFTSVFAREDVPAEPIIQQPVARVFLPMVHNAQVQVSNSQASGGLKESLPPATTTSDRPDEETKEIVLSTNEEIAAALSEVGYSDEQIKAVFEMSNQLGEAYQNGASQKELQAIADKYEPILQTSPELSGRSITATTGIASWKWILQWLERGSTARYDVKFGPYVGTFYYLTFSPTIQLHTHWKFGFCFKIFGGRCTVHQTSWAQGLFIAHSAVGNSVSSPSWWPN